MIKTFLLVLILLLIFADGILTVLSYKSTEREIKDIRERQAGRKRIWGQKHDDIICRLLVIEEKLTRKRKKKEKPDVGTYTRDKSPSK